MANTHHLTGTGPHKVIALHGWFGDQHAFTPVEAMLTGSEFSVWVARGGGAGIRMPMRIWRPPACLISPSHAR